MKTAIKFLNENASKVFAILSVAGFVGFLLTADYSEYDEQSEENEPEWPMINISPWSLKKLQNGEELKIRMFETEPDDFVFQTTTLDGWPEQAQESYNKRVK